MPRGIKMCRDRDAYQKKNGLARLLDCHKPVTFWKEPSRGTKAVSLPLRGIATAVQNRRLRREFRKCARHPGLRRQSASDAALSSGPVTGFLICAPAAGLFCIFLVRDRLFLCYKEN